MGASHEASGAALKASPTFARHLGAFEADVMACERAVFGAFKAFEAIPGGSGACDMHGLVSELSVIALRTPARLVERPHGIQSFVAREAAEVL